MLNKPNCLCTAIGSLPHTDAYAAVDSILSTVNNIPFWPQLPKLNFYETMCPQFSEAIPGVVIDKINEKIHVDTSNDFLSEVEKCYENYIAENLEYFKISMEYACGLYTFIDRILKLKNQNTQINYIKGHITGPITWGLTITDQNLRASFYDSQLRDCIEKTLEMKVKWQVKKLKESGYPVVIFIDEPYIQSVGSALVSLKSSDVESVLNNITESLHSEDVTVGIHCCGNTDWGIIAKTKIDIINFDAYNYAESLSLFYKELYEFLEKGGILAWGIVPTSADINNEDSNSLLNALREKIKLFTKKGLDENKILESSLITPSCGAGYLSVDESVKVLNILSEISNALRGIS